MRGAVARVATALVLTAFPISTRAEMWWCPPQVDVTLDCGTCAVPGVYGMVAHKLSSSLSGDRYIAWFTDAIGVLYTYTFTIPTYMCAFYAVTPWQDLHPAGGSVTPVAPPLG